ncbi:MAG TPA: serine/threonine-protein kinase [Steroidobacteraceae bacterium]|nr:serine/threonine-protein kinase [Steroidobacteraceae bacterium]
MTPQRWEQLKSVLHEAMQLGPGERLTYLDHISVCDPGLRSELDTLLTANEEIPEALRTTPAALAAALHAAEGLMVRDPLLGARVGAYEIIEELGSGGMGKVYRAARRDDEFEQVVAIKLVRAGGSSFFVLKRLHSERQILASLDHPNITRLLDGGTTAEGLPYLIMEFVDGQPIHRYCAARQLDLAERLRLFVQVCSAVHYAHQRLIIHRDIKPSNILMTADGIPKLLDFGIAKILDPERAPLRSTATVSMVRLLTPAYASPEQMRGEAITTASDIYSLGVVLYELLTGFGPHAMFVSAQGAATRPSTLVRRGPPPPDALPLPMMRSALSRRLVGDLDNIVLKAIHPEPERRYSSAEQLAADIRAHLQRRPVLARPDTLGYRCSRFLARHTAAAILCAMLSTALMACAGIIWNEARIAQAERARAERRFDDVHRLASSLTGEIYPAIQDLPGSTAARQLIIDRALQYLDSLARDAGGDAPLERELAAAYSLLGDLQGNGYYGNLGNANAALESYRKALTIRQRMADAAPRDAAAARALATSYRQIGVALDGLRHFDAALVNYRAAAQQFQRAVAGNPDARALDGLAGQYFYLADAAVDAGRLDEAEASNRHGMDIRRRIVASDPRVSMDVLTHSAGDHFVTARILEHRGQLERAAAEAQTCLDMLSQLMSADPSNHTLRTFRGAAAILRGEIEEQRGRGAQALASYRSALPDVQAVLAADPANARARSYVAHAYERIGALESHGGEVARGVADLEQALGTMAPLRSSELAFPDFRALVAECYAELASAYEALAATQRSAARARSLQAAHASYRESLDRLTDLQRRGLLTVWEQARPAAVERALDANQAALGAALEANLGHASRAGSAPLQNVPARENGRRPSASGEPRYRRS